MAVLHITNGDSTTTLIQVGLDTAAVIPWRDTLHEGPVPLTSTLEELSAIRAKFIGDVGWTTHKDAERMFQMRDEALVQSLEKEEVVLWFEHDLYDQLQLIQILSWFAEQPRVPRLTLNCDEIYLGEQTADELAALFPGRKPVTAEQLALAATAWNAFRQPTPVPLVHLISENTSALPFLAAALQRHLQELPDARTGLSRTETQILQILSEGPSEECDLFLFYMERLNEPKFMGDAPFYLRVRELQTPPRPLIEDDECFFNITEDGRATLNGEIDRLAIAPIDRWLGGVHLRPGGSVWRWDPEWRP